MELITRNECSELFNQLHILENQVEVIVETCKPTLNGERYLSGPELCERLNITKRTLQGYRDLRQIPYIMLHGKTLYKESDILKILEENYVPSISY